MIGTFLRYVAPKLPMKVQHRIRRYCQMLEYRSGLLVVPEEMNPTLLIENTGTPNFEAYDATIKKLEERWGIHDNEIAALKSRARFVKFKLGINAEVKI